MFQESCPCHGADVGVRDNLSESFFFFLNCVGPGEGTLRGSQDWQQAPLPINPSYWPYVPPLTHMKSTNQKKENKHKDNTCQIHFVWLWTSGLQHNVWSVLSFTGGNVLLFRNWCKIMKSVGHKTDSSYGPWSAVNVVQIFFFFFDLLSLMTKSKIFGITTWLSSVPFKFFKLLAIGKD